MRIRVPFSDAVAIISPEGDISIAERIDLWAYILVLWDFS